MFPEEPQSLAQNYFEERNYSEPMGVAGRETLLVSEVRNRSRVRKYGVHSVTSLMELLGSVGTQALVEHASLLW